MWADKNQHEGVVNQRFVVNDLKCWKNVEDHYFYRRF